jgi:hypothetical protein
METIVRIDNSSNAAKLFLEYIKTLSFAKVENPQSVFNKETEKAIREAQAGIGIIKTTSHEDLMKKLRS